MGQSFKAQLFVESDSDDNYRISKGSWIEIFALFSSDKLITCLLIGVIGLFILGIFTALDRLILFSSPVKEIIIIFAQNS